MPKFIGKAISKLLLKPGKRNKSDLKRIDSSSHFILLTIKTHISKEWIKLGISLQRLLLKLTELGISSAYLNQPCKLESLSTELQQRLPINSEYPSIILRIRYTKGAPFSPRKDVDKIIEGIIKYKSSQIYGGSCTECH